MSRNIKEREWVLTEEQKCLLLGSILGDVSVEKNGENCRVRFDHSIRQKEYTLWKHSLMKPFSCKYTFYPTRPHEKTGNISQKIRFSTRTLPVFNWYRTTFYPLGKKIVPPTIKELFKEPFSLLIWFLDDGSIRNDSFAFRLHTNSFNEDDQQLLQEMLSENFGIQSTLQTQDKSKVIAIGATNGQSKKFYDIVEPIIKEKIPSMGYKVYNEFSKPCND